MWDEDDFDEEREDPGDALVRAAWRFLGWRRSVRRRAREVRAIWQEDDLDIDWGTFARTKGSLDDGSPYDFLGGFMQRMPAEYEVKVLSPGEMVAEGGWCAPLPRHEPVWRPWADYRPPFKLPDYMDLIPKVTFLRGGVKYAGLPGAGEDDS